MNVYNKMLGLITKRVGSSSISCGRKMPLFIYVFVLLYVIRTVHHTL
jgi:uncharacterized membrane protein YadS